MLPYLKDVCEISTQAACAQKHASRMDERTKFPNQQASYDTINETGADSDDCEIKGDELRCSEQLPSDFIRTGETAISAQRSTVEGPKNNNVIDIAVYKRRWYILFVFCLVCFITGGVWNTWGPIAISVEPAVGWTNANIGLVSTFASVSASVSAPACAWVMDVKGKSGGTFMHTTYPQQFFKAVYY